MTREAERCYTVLVIFAEAQKRGQRQGLTKRDTARAWSEHAKRLNHPQRRREMAERDARRRQEWAEARATRVTWSPGKAPPVPMRTRA